MTNIPHKGELRKL